mmetsp:Transcript_5326/g.11550  ORF Transcript_5326/g.11550 Transcript_5326/m.11550 type:complete len:210 (+) Transcript_5326:319-948(+)
MTKSRRARPGGRPAASSKRPRARTTRRMHRRRSGRPFQAKKGGLMLRARRRQRPIDAARRCPRRQPFGHRPSGQASNTAPPRTNETTKTSRPVRHPLPGVVTRDKPGPTEDRRRPTSENVILRRMGRGPKAPRAPGSQTKSVARARDSESMPRGRAAGDRREAAGAGWRTGRLKGWQWQCHLKGCRPRGKRKGGEQGQNNNADSGWKLF